MQPLNLGPGPSLLGDDPQSQIQTSAGFEVSDFNGAFTPGAIFQPTSSRVALGPIEVVHAGSVAVVDRLAVFDPLDTHPEETVFTFRRAVPPGRHDVFLARAHGIIASLIRFRDAPAVRWSPALFDSLEQCPRPPLFPMFSTRFAVGFADAGAAADCDLDADQAAEAVRQQQHQVSEGMVALDLEGAGQFASWFGEDASGQLVALATEYGGLRQLTVESVRIPVSAALGDRVTLEDRALVLVAPALEDTFMVVLRPFSPILEGVCLESEGEEEQRPSTVAQEAGKTRYEFAVRPAGSDVIRLDFAGVSRPLLHLDPGSVARKLEHWRSQELLAVEAAAIPALARRFCESRPPEIRDWLVDQDEVDDLFF